MNKFLHAIIGMMIAASPVLAQNDAISKFFSEYESGENVTTLSFSGKAFEMLHEIDSDDPDAEKAIEMASQIDGLRVIIDSEHENARNTAKIAHKEVLNNFEDLVTVSEKDALIYVMVDEQGGIVNEVLVIVGSESEFILVSMTGAMNLRDVGELTSQMSVIGTEVFAESSVNPNEIKVYPNPATKGNNVTIDLPENFDGGTVWIFDSSGAEVMSYKSGSDLKKLDTSSIGKGIFVLKAKKGELETTRKFVVQ